MAKKRKNRPAHTLRIAESGNPPCRPPDGWDPELGCVPQHLEKVPKLVTLQRRHVDMLRRWGARRKIVGNFSRALRVLIEWGAKMDGDEA